MKRLTMPCLLALLSVSMAVPACAGAYEKCIKPVTSQITWSGSATELVDVVAQFLLCDGGSAAAAPACAFADLEALASSLGPEGAQVVNCLLKYHAENGTAKVRERARAVGAKRGVNMSALKCEGAGKVALRSPGEAKVPAAPTAAVGDSITFLTGTAPLLSTGSDLMITVAADWHHADGCPDGTRNVSPMAPGAVCIRDGVAWNDVLAAIAGLHIKLDSTASNPLADAAVDMAHALVFCGPMDAGGWQVCP
jgi:hypothetical protein